ncbi:MAG TPA: potassium-transporting ATPase subunit KdpA [Bryobacteraceae bacterium]|nr:potassium-transporting ATPase subunit KdpA [Bryobacteraceae bacterium]
MTWADLCQLIAFVLVLVAIARVLGAYMADVFEGRPTFLSKPLLPVERLIYRFCRVDPKAGQTWMAYAGACLIFGLVNFLLFYALLRLQGILPLNPQRFGTALARPGSTPVTPDLAFNIAVSFMTNTSWQSYAGETTLSYLSQMLGVAVESFTSAAAGMAVAMALIRGLVRQKSEDLGNFWVDVTRATLYILLPLSLLGAVFLCSEGVIQNFRPYRQVETLEAGRQTIPLGPAASQESIKLMSSDGGGFFNANSAHPFENPTPVSNFVEMLLILAIPAGLTFSFGRMVGDQRQGWTLFAAMLVLFCGGASIATWSERGANPRLSAAGVTARHGVNMEGKEVRFGIGGSALFSVVSTASADGAMNSAHESFTPLAGLVQMFNLKTGEVIFGGVGTGLVSMLLTVLLAVFIAGLMVGRTPEYLGKRIEAKEVKMVMLSTVVVGASILTFSAATFVVHFAPSGYWNPPGNPTVNLANQGPRGLSEILYDNASAAATNGSAFAGLNANTPWFNLTLGLEMLIGRFFVIIPALAIAGNLARKPKLAITSGTISTHGPLFVSLLLGTTVLITALTFFPTLSLAPIAEHYLMHGGVLFR